MINVISKFNDKKTLALGKSVVRLLTSADKSRKHTKKPKDAMELKSNRIKPTAVESKSFEKKCIALKKAEVELKVYKQQFTNKLQVFGNIVKASVLVPDATNPDKQVVFKGSGVKYSIQNGALCVRNDSYKKYDIEKSKKYHMEVFTVTKDVSTKLVNTVALTDSRLSYFKSKPQNISNIKIGNVYTGEQTYVLSESAITKGHVNISADILSEKKIKLEYIDKNIDSVIQYIQRQNVSRDICTVTNPGLCFKHISTDKYDIIILQNSGIVKVKSNSQAEIKNYPLYYYKVRSIFRATKQISGATERKYELLIEEISLSEYVDTTVEPTTTYVFKTQLIPDRSMSQKTSFVHMYGCNSSIMELPVNYYNFEECNMVENFASVISCANNVLNLENPRNEIDQPKYIPPNNMEFFNLSFGHTFCAAVVYNNSNGKNVVSSLSNVIRENGFHVDARMRVVIWMPNVVSTGEGGSLGFLNTPFRVSSAIVNERPNHSLATEHPFSDLDLDFDFDLERELAML